VAHFAHLGGIVTGFLYLKGHRSMEDQARKLTRTVKRRRLAIVPREEEAGRPGIPPRPSPAERSDEKALYDAVDRVLDKISAHGMASLTPDELKLLDDMSRRHRAN